MSDPSPEPTDPADSGVIDRDDVAKVARLARLEVADHELDTFTAQLRSILSHAQELDALDLDGVPPTSHPYPLRNVMRPDVVVAGVDRDEVLAQAPAAEQGMFRVPPVLGEAP